MKNFIPEVGMKIKPQYTYIDTYVRIITAIRDGDEDIVVTYDRINASGRVTEFSVDIRHFCSDFEPVITIEGFEV